MPRLVVAVVAAVLCLMVCAQTSAAAGRLAVVGSWQNDCHYEQNAAAQPSCARSSQLLVSPDDGEGAVRTLANCPFSYTVFPCQLGVPAFSPDGRQLAASRDGKLSVFDIHTGAETRLPVPAGLDRPAWSPDGRRIATVDPQGISVARPDGRGLVRVAPAGSSTPQWFRRDGHLRLAYMAPNLGLAVTDAVGSNTQTLLPAGRVKSFTTAPGGRIVYADSRVVYINHRPTFGRVLTIAPGSRTPHQLSRVRPSIYQPTALSFSPSGRRLLYTTGVKEGSEVRAFTWPSGRLRTLYRSNRSNGGPFGTWSPDERYATITEEERITRVRSTGGAARLVLSGEPGQPYVDGRTGGLLLSAPSWAAPV